MVKKLKRQEASAVSPFCVASPPVVRSSFCDDQWRPSRIGREGETHGFGAHPGLRHGDGGPRVAGAKRISGCRKPHPKGPVEGRLKLSDAGRATLGEIGHR